MRGMSTCTSDHKFGRHKPAPTFFMALFVALQPGIALAAGVIEETQKQNTDWTAIIMFTIFVGASLWITKWAAKRTRSAADFYTAGGGITGFQNGLAIAGDFMSAASFLGISAAVMATGFDRYIRIAS